MPVRGSRKRGRPSRAIAKKKDTLEFRWKGDGVIRDGLIFLLTFICRVYLLRYAYAWRVNLLHWRCGRDDVIEQAIFYRRRL